MMTTEKPQPCNTMAVLKNKRYENKREGTPMPLLPEEVFDCFDGVCITGMHLVNSSTPLVELLVLKQNTNGAENTASQFIKANASQQTALNFSN